MVQERYPQVDVTPVGFLVGNIANHQWLTLTLVLHDMAQSLLHRNAYTTKTLADIEEQSVEVRILDGVIQLGTDTIVRHGQWQGADPLPVTIVTQHDTTRDALAPQFLNSLRALEHHTTTHLLLADGHQFDALHQIVAEPVVEALLNLLKLLGALLRKSRGNVLADDFGAIASDTIQDKVHDIREDIMYPHREY